MGTRGEGLWGHRVKLWGADPMQGSESRIQIYTASHVPFTSRPRCSPHCVFVLDFFFFFFNSPTVLNFIQQRNKGQEERILFRVSFSTMKARQNSGRECREF